jgi:hypothetical protein
MVLRKNNTNRIDIPLKKHYLLTKSNCRSLNKGMFSEEVTESLIINFD